MPHAWLGSIPAAALLFFRVYEHGVASRAVGFALTFYPSALMLIASAITLAHHSIVG